MSKKYNKISGGYQTPNNWKANTKNLPPSKNLVITIS
jgi:hypothetical protein